MPPKSIAIKPPKRGIRKVPEMPASDDAELISVGPVLVRPARRVQRQLEHRYRVGERLRLGGGGTVLSRAASYCKVIALLPYEGRGALLYRVRSDSEQFERVVAEADLSRNSSDA